LPVTEASRASSTFEGVDITIAIAGLINDGAREAVGTADSEKSLPCKEVVPFVGVCGRETPEGSVNEGTRGRSSRRDTGRPVSRGARTRN